jgi:hypothetical protein
METIAYLIATEEARRIGEIPEEAAFCYGKVIPEDESQAWINKGAMDGLRALGRDPLILSESEELPSFHSLASAIDTAEYGPVLTVEALVFDPEAVGVVYVGWGCEREIALQLMEWRDRFFYFSLKESRPYLWLILSDPTGQYGETGRDVARWAYRVLYDRDENFKAWLEGLGFDLTEEEEED